MPGYVISFALCAFLAVFMLKQWSQLDDQMRFMTWVFGLCALVSFALIVIHLQKDGYFDGLRRELR